MVLKIPKKFKRNEVNVDLHRTKNIASDFTGEKAIVIERFKEAGFPQSFIASVIKRFDEKEHNDIIIPENLFELPKRFVSVSVPFCQKN